MEKSLEEKLKAAWLKVCVNHRAPSIAFTGFWFRFTECPLHFITLSGHIKCYFCCLKKEIMNDFSIHWSESLTWAKCSVAQGFKGNPHSPVLHSTLWRPLSNCCASPVHKQRLQHRQNCCLLCVHTGVWRGWDNTFLKIISVGGTQSLFSGDFCNHECISQQTQNPGVKRCPSHVAAAGWCEHGISPWTGFAGVRQLSPEPEQVYMGPAMCIASRNSWSSPPICWLLRGHAPWWRFLGTAKLMWLSWKSHSKLSLPPKWGEVKDSILQNAYFPMVVHIFDVLPSW